MAHGRNVFKLILRIEFGKINCTGMGQVSDNKGIL
jgi:hypothetical protein